MMTDQELKELVASLAMSHRETEKVLRELSQAADRRAQDADGRFAKLEEQADRRAQDADRRAQDADRRLAKLDEQFAKTDKHLKKVSEMVGGMSNNQGQIAEEFFYRSFKKPPQLGTLRFDTVYRNLRGSTHGIEDEFDLILVNGDTLALFEVKTKAPVKVVKTLIDQKIPHLRIMLPCFHEHKIYAGIASLVTYENLIKEVEEHGLFLLTQQGKHLEVVNAQVRLF
jgi:hypothetical protein